MSELLNKFTMQPNSMQCQSDFRFSEKNHQTDLFKKYWEEQIRLYGMRVDYQVYDYQIENHDFLYGEHPTANFLDPVSMIIGVKMNEDNSAYTKFGVQTKGQITVYIPISIFTETFGEGSEPKAKDLITLTEYGESRPNGRNGEIYEVVFRDDQVLNETNQLMGHYVWVLEATRYDPSFEENANTEELDAVYDNPFFGELSGDSFEGQKPPLKKYDDETTTESKKIFDYGQNKVNTDIFGYYD